MKNLVMDVYEKRWLMLRALATKLGRGGITHIADKIGKEANYVSRMLYEPGKRGRKRIGEDMERLISQAFPGWLSGSDETGNAEEAPALGRFLPVPVVGTAQLGDNHYWSELEYPPGHGDGYINMPVKDEHAYALRCKGDSMQPRIKHGEYVIVEPTQAPIPGDDVLLKHVDGRVMVKRFLYIRDGVIYLMSVNDAHPPQSFPLSEVDKFHRITAIVSSAFFVPR